MCTRFSDIPTFLKKGGACDTTCLSLFLSLYPHMHPSDNHTKLDKKYYSLTA